MNLMANERNDEIDLIEIWLVIIRHLRLFIFATLIVVVAGMIFSFLHTPSYDYSVTVQIGGIRNRSAFDLVEKPESVVAALQNSIIPSVLAKYASTHPGSELAALKIDVTNPANSDVVVLRARGTVDQKNQITEVLTSVIDELDATHGSLLKEHVEDTKRLLTSEIADNTAEIDHLLKSRNQITRTGDSSSKALTLLLIDDQVSNLQRNLFNLRQQLEVGLVADVRMTHPISKPQRSNKPAGLTRSLLLLISALSGLLVGLIAVFVARVLELAQERKES